MDANTLYRWAQAMGMRLPPLSPPQPITPKPTPGPLYPAPPESLVWPTI